MSARLSVRGAVLCSLLALVVGISIGLLIGYLLSISVPDPSYKRQVELLRLLAKDGWSEEPYITRKIIDKVSTEEIKENLRLLSKEPHVASTRRDKELAEIIRNRWKEHGLENIEMVPYDVLLSFPNPKKPNMIQVLGNHDKILFNISCLDVPLSDEEKLGEHIPPYHAYSPKGVVEGHLVYVYDGTEVAIQELEYIYEVSLKGNIALIQEGGGPMGDKLRALHQYGAIGAITFPDPLYVAEYGTDPESVYPHTKWLPKTGIVRSSAALEKGDPVTPGFPSIKEAYRKPMNEVLLPPIPSQPISYDSAMKLLSIMGGQEAPEFWIGSLNVTYNLGPGFNKPRYRKVRLIVNNENVPSTQYNVIGSIGGAIEPDRYVIMGNHRDAWSFGAVDPSSGTAMMLEVTRVFGELLREGWRPRRTLVFCSWAAEEFALIGSTEWVEEKLPKLHERAVTYINSDVCAVGPSLEVMASPVLHDSVYHITRLIPDPEKKEKNLFEAWLKDMQPMNNSEKKLDEPKFKPIGPYSDFAAFLYTAGIPVIDFTFQTERKEMSLISYPGYHTRYDTFHAVETIFDPTFTRHRGCAHIAGLMMRYLADVSLLPFNIRTLALDIKTAVEKIIEDGIYLPEKEKSDVFRNIRQFLEAADAWYARLNKMDKQNPIIVRMLNDQLMSVEKAFTFLPLRDENLYFIRHRVYLILGYAYESSENELRQHLSDLATVLHQATDVLRTFTSA